MSKQRDFLLRAATELGLRVEANPTIKLPREQHVVAWVRFPDLGTKRGMFVLSSTLSTGVMEELLSRGFPASFLPEPGAGEAFDLDRYKILFQEWGWASPAKRPAWMAG